MRIFRQAIGSLSGSASKDQTNDQEGGGRTNSVGPTFYVDKKYQTPDFLFQSPKSHNNTFGPLTTTRKTQLNKNFFSQLSQLETKLHDQRHRSLDLIDNLVRMYKQCAEVYDSLQDPIKYYFVDKIQSALADQKTWNVINKLEALDDKVQIVQSVKYSKKSSEHDSDEVFHDIDENLNQFNRNVESLMILNKELFQQTEDNRLPGSKRGSFQNLKSSSPNQELEDEEDFMRINQRARSKKVTIIKKVQAETQQSSENMSNMMNHYQNDVAQTDLIIKDALLTQDNSLQDRLKRRGHKQQLQRKMGHSSTTGILEAPSKDLEKFMRDYKEDIE